MPKLRRASLACAAIGAALVMALSVGSATAGKFSITNQAYRITWERLWFFLEGAAEKPTIRCPTTLEGSFHSATIVKSPGQLAGYVTRAQVNEAACIGGIGGRARFVTTSLPWHMKYGGFTGTLPIISRIFFPWEGVTWEVRNNGLECYYRESGTERIIGEFKREASGDVSEFVFEASVRIAYSSGTIGCQPESGIVSLGRVRVLERLSSTFTMRLI